MRRLVIAAVVVWLTASSTLPQPQAKTASQEEEIQMAGRLAAAIEDVGGGYTKEGLSRFTWINKALTKREYSLWTRWTAHRWYAQALLDSGKAQAALDLAQKAEAEANALTVARQKETAKQETAKLRAEIEEKLSRK